MKPFKDAHGRDWSVAIDTHAIKRVRDHTGLLLTKVVEDRSLVEQLADPIMLVDVLFVVCKPEADQRGVSDEQFASGLVGDAIDHATDALIGALADFFPSARASLLRTAWGKARTAEERATARAMANLQAIDPDRLMEMVSGESSGSSPASSASTPAR